MRRPRFVSWVVFGVQLCFSLLAISPDSVAAAPSLETPAGLSIAELKITGDEYILLENNSGADISASELSNYWIYAFNSNNPLATGVSSSSQQLPSAVLATGQTLLLNSVGGSTCGAAVTDGLSLSLSDSSGYLEVVKTSLDSGILSQTPVDFAVWGSSSQASVYQVAASAITTPSGSSSSATIARTSFASYRYLDAGSGDYWWQPASLDSNDSCQLDVLSSPAVANVGNSLLPSLPPPAIIETLASSGDNSSGLPTSDSGLRAPQITELLPNPAAPTSDSDGEFIELYNPNNAEFELGNFSLQTSSTRKYTFPLGVRLKALSFTAYKLKGTGLSLSNSGGQVSLLDPFGSEVSQTDAYGTAKDGLAWALANDNWYWTTTPTPSAENRINQASGKKSSSTKSAPQVLSASSFSGSGLTASSASSAAPNATAQVASVHPWTLVGVGGAALIYAGYEYKTELANNLYRLRRYAAARRASRK